uniref:Putative secreted peptide n=1 Tax=Anopheles braziliensis TaxID=58242 RepID=A0A2M3ZNK1_9DIPT
MVVVVDATMAAVAAVVVVAAAAIVVAAPVVAAAVEAAVAPVLAADVRYSIPDAIQRHLHHNHRNGDVVVYVLSGLAISVAQSPAVPTSVLALYDSRRLLRRYLHSSLRRPLLLLWHFEDGCQGEPSR